jgi:hypothetical protein
MGEYFIGFWLLQSFAISPATGSFASRSEPFRQRSNDHAVNCSICYGQAMLAFLWKNLGATDSEILLGMERKFGHLAKPESAK